MSTKELQDQIASTMKSWQKIENASVAGTGKVLERTDNPLVRLVMEIIQRDSMLHYRVQGMIADSLTKTAVSVTPDELIAVWDMIEDHINLEKQTLDMAREALEGLKGKKMVVQEYLLNYLMEDETKHNKLLETLEMIKKGMYPYG